MTQCQPYLPPALHEGACEDKQWHDDELWQRLVLERRLEQLEQMLDSHGLLAQAPREDEHLGVGGMLTSVGGAGSGSGDDNADSTLSTSKSVSPLLPEWGKHLAAIIAQHPRSSDLQHHAASESVIQVNTRGELQHPRPGEASESDPIPRTVPSTGEGDKEVPATRVHEAQDHSALPGDTLGSSELPSLPGRIQMDRSRSPQGYPEGVDVEDAGISAVGDLPPMKAQLQEQLELCCRDTKAKFHIFALHRDGRPCLPATTCLLQHGRCPPARDVPGWALTCLRCGNTVEVRRWKQCRTSTCRVFAQTSARAKGPPTVISKTAPQTIIAQGWKDVEKACSFLESLMSLIVRMEESTRAG